MDSICKHGYVQVRADKVRQEHRASAVPFVPKAITDVDRRHCRRTVPMRVLALGLSRTGTNSLRLALERLGYNSTYHGYVAVFENPRDCEMWLQGLRAKFHNDGKPFGRSEFDQLLGHCQAVTDAPAVCFAAELIEAYPDAKVILTNRDIDCWYKSVMSSLIPQVYNPKAAVLARVACLFRSNGRWSRPVYTLVFDKYFRHFPTNGKAVFREHYAMIRRLVPKDQLLEYDIKQGWGPLCEFLCHAIPGEPFPRTNDNEATDLMIKQLVSFELRKAFWVALYILGLVVLYIIFSVC